MLHLVVPSLTTLLSPPTESPREDIRKKGNYKLKRESGCELERAELGLRSCVPDIC